MNTFFFNLGKSTRNVQDAVVVGTGNAGEAIADAAKSFAQGYSAQRVANTTDEPVAAAA